MARMSKQPSTIDKLASSVADQLLKIAPQRLTGIETKGQSLGLPPEPQAAPKTGAAKGGGSWTKERDALLSTLWDEGNSASEIARALGGVTRNAVIGRASRLGLAPSPAFDPDAESDDPIEALDGASVRLNELLGWQSLAKRPYLAAEVRQMFRQAEANIEPRRLHDGVALLSAVDLVRAIFGSGNVAGLRAPSIDPGFFEPFRDDLTPWESLSGAALRSADVVVRWDVVRILAMAARVRDDVEGRRVAIRLSHLLCAIFLEKAGRVGLREAGLASRDFGVFLERIFPSFERSLHLDKGRYDAWYGALVSIGGLGGDVTRTRPDYASDRVVAGRDALGAVDDARALADLILLDAAEPPLAIGIFGPWGSGKSTLLAELRNEIDRQAQEERDQRTSGLIAPADVSRLCNVIQLEFNAWTFADSDNLWASLTSELFDQLAAGGVGASTAKPGADLVASVAERVTKEEGLLKAAKIQLDQYDQEIRNVVAEQAVTSLRDRTKFVDAATSAFAQLLGKADETKEGSETNKPAASDALAPFKNALLIGEGVDPDDKARRYAEAGGDMARSLLIVADYIRARRKRAIAFGASALILVLLWIGVERARFVIPRFGLPRLSWLLPLAGYGALLARFLAPALRASSVFRTSMQGMKKRVADEQRDQAMRREAAETSKTKAQEAAEKSRLFVEKYGNAHEVASAPPSLMLEFLLQESSDITAIKNRLGLLGTVRRVFQQLDAVIRDGRTRDPSGAVQRIVIYIDDLDRCSEKQVVQVLEAIHLLLAFPCFVVLVAVDAKWLELSLDKQTQVGSPGSAVAAADYLEKIFQIPFWMRSLRASASERTSAYTRYLGSILGTDAQEPVAVEAAEDLADVPHDIATQALTRLPPFAPAADLATERVQLRLTGKERALFERLGGIAARSPRAVKRMVNLYRLIRVSLKPDDIESYLSNGEHYAAPWFAVQFVLANEVGRSASAMQQFADMLRHSDFYWSGWTQRQLTGANHAENALSQLSQALGGEEARAAFLQALGEVEELAGRLPTRSEMMAALDVVERYSFRAGSRDV